MAGVVAGKCTKRHRHNQRKVRFSCSATAFELWLDRRGLFDSEDRGNAMCAVTALKE
jgi:hypothetical protein